MSLLSKLSSVALCAGLLCPIGASATLVSLDDVVFGANSITFDSSTNLEWLDLTKSTSRSYDFVSSQFGAGGMFEGFRYATLSELVQLELNFGFTLINSHTYVTGNGVPAFNFLNLLGNTRPYTDNTYNPYTEGFVSGAEMMVVGGVCFDGVCDGSPLDQGHAFSRGIFPTFFQSPYVGSFLVRSAPAPVPEPTTVALLGLALAGMGVTRRRTAIRG